MTTQTQPNLDTKCTWTGEPNYTRYFIIRLFKPIEYATKNLAFDISLNGDNYTSKNFVTKKTEKVIILFFDWSTLNFNNIPNYLLFKC